MQNKKVEQDYIMVSIPKEVIEQSGITNEQMVQITASKGKIVIEAVDDIGDVVCDNDCKDCPVYEIEGDNCPNKENELGR